MKHFSRTQAVQEAIRTGSQVVETINAKQEASRTDLNRREAADLKAQQKAGAGRAAR